MTRRLFTLLVAAAMAMTVAAQATADDVLAATRKANDYFMKKYEDPTVPTNWKRVRLSSL